MRRWSFSQRGRKQSQQSKMTWFALEVITVIDYDIILQWFYGVSAFKYFFSKAKTVRGVIPRYTRALHAFNQGGSMKRAFQKVGVDRNTISRTSPIAELALAAPGVFQALPPWNAQVEKLATFVDRCREATTDEIKEKIVQMKACGELLPMTHWGIGQQ